MSTPFSWPAALLGAGLGVPAGYGLRVLLARLPRGVVLRPGVLEVAAAVITGVGAGLIGPEPALVLVIWTGLLGVALGAVDLVHHRLPDAITVPAVPITAALLVAVWLIDPTSGSLFRALLVAVVVTGLSWGVATALPRALGRGDVKLAASLALLTGYLSVAATLLAITLAFVFGAVVAIAGLLTRRLTLTSAIPFGPFLLAGSWLVLAVPSLVTSVIG